MFLAASVLRAISDVYYDKVKNPLNCQAERGNFDHGQSYHPGATVSRICDILLLAVGHQELVVSATYAQGVCLSVYHSRGELERAEEVEPSQAF
jgi:hypothetical protein